MKRQPTAEERAKSSGLIGEMMLAKTVLEEKNEIIARKDRLIQELETTRREMEERLRATEKELASARRDRDEQIEAVRRQTLCKSAGQMAALAVDWQADGADVDADEHLASQIVRMLEEEHRIEILDRVAGTIDPRRHRVVETADSEDGTSRVEVLQAGIVLDDYVVRPALVRVWRSG